MTCTKAPKKQAIFRIFSPISGIFRGYCKTLSTKTRIATVLDQLFVMPNVQLQNTVH